MLSLNNKKSRNAFFFSKRVDEEALTQGGKKQGPRGRATGQVHSPQTTKKVKSKRGTTLLAMAWSFFFFFLFSKS